MRKLAEKNVGRVIDLLNERLAFERTGVRLYDRMLLRMLLTAELADTAGWDLLVRVAGEFGDREARREFKERHREEQEHVLFVRKVVERFVKRELQEQPMPLTYL